MTLMDCDSFHLFVQSRWMPSKPDGTKWIKYESVIGVDTIGTSWEQKRISWTGIECC